MKWQYIVESEKVEFLCKNYYQEVNSLELNISSEYKIIKSNADIKKDNIHTWNINKTNYKNRPINITIEKNTKYKDNNKAKKNTKMNIQTILTIIIFILLIIVFIIRKKDQKKS